MVFKQIKDALEKGDINEVIELTKAALDKGKSIKAILDTLIGGMDIIGKKFKNNEIFIPEVLISAKAMHAGLNILEPYLSKSGIKPMGKIGIGTVKGDLHDIGKNLVGMMLEGGGFQVIDLGVDIPADKFVQAVKENNVKVIGLSALLTTTMSGMKEIIDALKADPATSDTKVMVGGAPLTQEYADSIGAAGYAPDASSAVDLANELLG